MVYIARNITQNLLKLSQKFPAVALIGPRQSGKTTLAKKVFADYRYVSLEDLDNRSFAETDPRGFLSLYDRRVIIDEAQKSPTLFSYLQTHLDNLEEPGQYILTGSQNFLLGEKISQSLSGRVGLLKLLPLTINELGRGHVSFEIYEEYIYHGFYPAVFARAVDPKDWYASYVQTYLERDVRSVLQVSNLSLFQKFIKLCAGRVGQVVNLTSLGSDCGISHNTAKAWLSILEASFVIFMVPPYFRNFNKRLIKSPKLYFWDTGLASHLLGLKNSTAVTSHYLKGGLFENLIGAEIAKEFYNRGEEFPLYFWRDRTGNEVDFIYESGNSGPVAAEIKAGQTYSPEMSASLLYWKNLSGFKSQVRLIYGGNQSQKRDGIEIFSWRNLLENPIGF